LVFFLAFAQVQSSVEYFKQEASWKKLAAKQPEAVYQMYWLNAGWISFVVLCQLIAKHAQQCNAVFGTTSLAYYKMQSSAPRKM
jgi:hypothetical protein